MQNLDVFQHKKTYLAYKSKFGFSRQFPSFLLQRPHIFKKELIIKMNSIKIMTKSLLKELYKYTVYLTDFYFNLNLHRVLWFEEIHGVILYQ